MNTIFNSCLSNYNNCCSINNPTQLSKEITETIVFERNLVDCKSIYGFKDSVKHYSVATCMDSQTNKVYSIIQLNKSDFNFLVREDSLPQFLGKYIKQNITTRSYCFEISHDLKKIMDSVYKCKNS